MICRHGGLKFVRHNDLRDIAAELLSKVCNDVAIEPPLQSLSGEVITPQSANRQDDARTLPLINLVLGTFTILILL